MNTLISDTTKLVAIPKWPGCIHRFSKLFDLHGKLAQHRGLLLSPHQICEAFLENIRVPHYRNMADNRLVNLCNVAPIDPQDGSLRHEWPLPPIWTIVEIAKDLEHHGTTVIERMRYGGNLRGAPPTGYQRPPTTYRRGAR